MYTITVADGDNYCNGLQVRSGEVLVQVKYGEVLVEMKYGEVLVEMKYGEVLVQMKYGEVLVQVKYGEVLLHMKLMVGYSSNRWTSGEVTTRDGDLMGCC